MLGFYRFIYPLHFGCFALVVLSKSGCSNDKEPGWKDLYRNLTGKFSAGSIMEQSCNKVKQPTELFQIKTDINLIQQISSCYEKIATLQQNEASE